MRQQPPRLLRWWLLQPRECPRNIKTSTPEMFVLPAMDLATGLSVGCSEAMNPGHPLRVVWSDQDPSFAMKRCFYSLDGFFRLSVWWRDCIVVELPQNLERTMLSVLSTSVWSQANLPVQNAVDSSVSSALYRGLAVFLWACFGLSQFARKTVSSIGSQFGAAVIPNAGRKWCSFSWHFPKEAFDEDTDGRMISHGN